MSGNAEPADHYAMLRVALPQRGPLDWPAMADWLAARTVARLETVTTSGGPTLRRTTVLDGRPAVIELGPTPATAAPTAGPPDGPDPAPSWPHDQRMEICVHIHGATELEGPRAQARRVLGSDLDIDEAVAHLRDDGILAPLVEARPGLRPPGCWDPYETTVRAVFAQQITMTAARTIAGRVVERFGTPVAGFEDFTLDRLFPQPSTLAGADLDDVGLTRTRAATVATVAAAAAEGFDFTEPDLVARMTALRGIGPWTAGYVAMRMGDPDVFPASDIALREAVGRLTGAARPTTRELTTISQRWRPWRSVAAIHLWYSLRDPANRQLRTRA